ncbi:glycosyltransferase family 4 protein [Pontibacter sp. XAAS-A31]|nr:glycosyltransferase family 4 protein [Pontibacter harenae]
MIEGLEEYNVKSVVLCPRSGDLTDELTNRKVPFMILPYFNWVYSKKWQLLKVPFKIVPTILLMPYYLYKIKKCSPDILYTNTSITGVGALLALIMKKPHVWHIRELLSEDYGLKYSIGNRLMTSLFNKAKYVITISKYLQRERLGNITCPTEVVYNGVISRSAISLVRNIDTKKYIKFGIVGFIHPPKGQEEAIEAFHFYYKQHKNASLMIVGDGPQYYVQKLKQECKRLEIQDKVEFTGYLRDTKEIYNNIDILLMCSRTEGMGRVTVEALARGIPVIGYNGSATPELINNNVNGLLYEKDAVDLFKKMSLLANDPELYKKMSQEAIKSTKANFTIENYSSMIYSVLQKVSTI